MILVALGVVLFEDFGLNIYKRDSYIAQARAPELRTPTWI